MDEQEFRLKFLTLVPRTDAEGIPSCNFSDAHVRGLRSELKHSKGFESWSQCPRTFALLFMVRDGRNMSALTASDFSDDILPYIDGGAYLRTTHGLTDSEIKLILKYHEWFLSPLESMDKIELFAEQGLGHRPIRKGALHFGFGEKLGPSGTAYVCRGTHIVSGTAFAIKLFSRKYPGAYKLFKTERSNLEKLRHPHLISLIGTYTDKIHFALILSPLATYDLKKVLAMDTMQGNTIGREHILRQSFGCLVSGLEYLHRNQIRHKDMKPGNILVHDGKVIICDLGIAYDWSESTGPTTSGTVDKQTWKYSAPEVSRNDPRNHTADIWSLGCVFLEIITVIQGHTIKDLHQRLKLWEDDPYHEKRDQILTWTKILSQQKTHNEPLILVKDMLDLEPLERPSALTLHRLIKDSCTTKNANERYIGDCCSESLLYPELSAEEPVQPQTLSPRPDLDAESLSTSRLENSEWHNENTETPDAATLIVDRPGSAELGNTTPAGESDGAPAPPLAATNLPPPVPTGDSSNTRHNGSTRSFGYPSELPKSVKDTQRTTAFRAEISAFEIFPHPVDGHCTVQTPPSRSTFRVSVTESTDQPVWRKYRFLEIHTVDGTLKESTWLPLHRLETKLDGSYIELQWSNCNHLVHKEAENFRSLWHRVFDPKTPNIHLRLRFVNAEDAEVLNQTLLNHRLCFHEDPNNNESFMVDLNANEKVASVHICKSSSTGTEIGARMIRINRTSNNFATSEIYATYIDYDIAVKMKRSSRLVVVDLEHIKAPVYHSDVRDLPYKNDDMEGRFGKVVEETKKLSMRFKLDDEDVAGPERSLSDFFHGMVGWHLLFVAPIKARRPSTYLLNKRSAEETILMLFNTMNNFEAPGVGAKIVFLFQNGRPGQHKWVSGELVQKKPWKKVGKDGEITIHRVQRAMRFGALSSDSQTPFKGGSSSYKLEFEDFDDLDSFNAQILPFERAQSFVSGQFHGPRGESRSTVSTRRSDTTREDSI